MQALRGTETAIGIDVGGTRIRVGRIDCSGTVLDRLFESVIPDREGFLAQILRLIETVRQPRDRAVGIGLPGRIKADRREIVSAGYLDIAGLDLSCEIRKRTGLDACLENDAAMALIAEMRLRKDEAHGLAAMITVGTGIGGAMVRSDQPWYGGGFAGQFGHIVVSDDGPVCNCGRTGCVETFSSGTALGRMMREAGLPDGMRAADILDLAERSDPRAAAVLRRWSEPMQRALETLAAAIDPVLIVIGGGLGSEMTRALGRLPPRSPWFDVAVETAHLGDDAGMIGAGLRAFEVTCA